MNRVPVDVRVGGHTYRLVGSAGDDELRRLAEIIDGKLRELGPGRASAPNSMLLVAMALAHDLEEERESTRRVEQRSRDMLRTLLSRIDAALEATPEPDDAPGETARPPT